MDRSSLAGGGGSGRPAVRRPARPFALIELVTVIMITGLLVNLAVPHIFAMRRKASEADTKAIIKDALTAIAQLYDDNQRTWPLLDPNTGEETTKLQIDKPGWEIALVPILPLGPVSGDLLPVRAFEPLLGIDFETGLPVDEVGTNNTHMLLMWTDDPTLGLLPDDLFDGDNDPFSFTAQGIPSGPPVVLLWTQPSGFSPHAGGSFPFDALGIIVPEPATVLLLGLAGALLSRRG